MNRRPLGAVELTVKTNSTRATPRRGLLLGAAGLLTLLLPALADAASFADYKLGEFYPVASVDEPAVQAVSPAVVRMSGATGFIIDTRGYVLTNHHVYESFGRGGEAYRQWTERGAAETLTLRLVARDKARDVALYLITNGDGPHPYIQTREAPARPGEEVFVLGHPDGDPQRASFGRVLADGLQISGRPSIEYSAQTWWGSSGSPVLDKRGRAVAIHWGWDSEGVSNGRLTGVPIAEVMALPAFAEALEGDAGPSRPATPSRPAIDCRDPKRWSLESTRVRASVRKNADGRWLDQVEVRARPRAAACAGLLRSVTFHLHPSFANPVVRRPGGEALTLYTWGSFDATAELRFQDGSSARFVDRVSWR